MLVYRGVNGVNGKTYVGATTQEFSARLAQHKSRAEGNLRTALCCAIRKYGWGAFEWEVIRHCDSVDAMRYAEKEEIALHGSFVPGGYNRTLGGNGVLGLDVSEESRAKMRAAQLARPPRDVETRMASSRKLKGRRVGGGPRKGERVPRDVVARRLATRAANRAEHKKPYFSPEVRARLSALSKERGFVRRGFPKGCRVPPEIVAKRVATRMANRAAKERVSSPA